MIITASFSDYERVGLCPTQDEDNSASLINRGLLNNGDHVCVQTESDQGIRVYKVPRLLAILLYTIA